MLTHDEKLDMYRRMKAYGGHFVSALAECFIYADEKNLQKLYNAFPEIVKNYGPNSPFSLYKGQEIVVIWDGSEDKRIGISEKKLEEENDNTEMD